MKKVIVLLIAIISLLFACKNKTDQVNETTHEVIMEKDHTEVKKGMMDTILVEKDTAK